MGFDKLKVHANIQKAIEKLGFKEPTDIQREAIPILLQGIDLIGQAQTGTGKTAAFAITILQTLKPSKQSQALILVPTRELVLQVVAEFRELGTHMQYSIIPIYGGEDIGRQIRALQHGSQIIVATPGRLLDHLQRRNIDLSHIHTCVVDEADRMLDMGFIDDVTRIISHIPKERQMMLFSATMPDAIVQLARRTMRNPEIIKVSEDKLPVEKISQHFIMSDPYHKIPILVHLLQQRKPKLTIVFTRTKRGADNLFYSLRNKNFRVTLLHGNLSQARREKSMHSFRHAHSDILVATDIAARGLDVDDVELIVNYNIPDDAYVYAHRIGRTARAGKSGDAITFVTNVAEQRNLQQFSRELNCKIIEIKPEGIILPKLPEEREEYRGFGQRPRNYSRGGGDDRHFSRDHRPPRRGSHHHSNRSRSNADHSRRPRQSRFRR